MNEQRTSEKLVENVKHAGAGNALFREIGSKLWDVKSATDAAEKDRCKNFKKEIKRARAALADAELLYEAWVKHDKQ